MKGKREDMKAVFSGGLGENVCLLTPVLRVTSLPVTQAFDCMD
jgi:hypothetical protein